jgi:hypothetical protein
MPDTTACACRLARGRPTASRQPVFVDQLEVEEGTHLGLAVCEQKGVAELARLVSEPRLDAFRRDRRHRPVVGLLTW